MDSECTSPCGLSRSRSAGFLLASLVALAGVCTTAARAQGTAEAVDQTPAEAKKVREEWGQRATPEVTLALEETRRRTMNKKDLPPAPRVPDTTIAVHYDFKAAGFPQHKTYRLWYWDINTELPRALGLARANDSGRLTRPDGSDLGYSWFAFAKGQAAKIAVISTDDSVRAFAEAILHPIEANADGCRLWLTVLTPDGMAFEIETEGFEGEEVRTVSRSGGEVFPSTVQIPPDARHVWLVAPGVIGKGSGRASFSVIGESCNLTVEYDWGPPALSPRCLLEECAVSNSDLAATHNDRGKMLLDQGKSDEAIAALREAIRLDPTLGSAHNTLGMILDDQGKSNEAIDEYREAIRLDPLSALAHSNLGIALTEQGNIEEAIGHLQEAIRLEPRFALAYSNLGVALIQQGKIEQGIDHHRKAIRLDPNLAWAHYRFGGALFSQGALEGAVVEYREAIRLDPNLAVAHSFLGAVLNEQGNFEEGVAELREAIHLDPNVAWGHYNLGSALLNLGKQEESVAASREALRLNPNNPHFVLAHSNLGAALLLQGNREEGMAELREAVRLAPDLARAHTVLGMALARLGELEQALAEFREASRLEPANAVLWMQLAQWYKQMGRDEDALHSMEMGLKADPGNAVILNDIGWFYVTSENPTLRDPREGAYLCAAGGRSEPRKGRRDPGHPGGGLLREPEFRRSDQDRREGFGNSTRRRGLPKSTQEVSRCEGDRERSLAPSAEHERQRNVVSPGQSTSLGEGRGESVEDENMIRRISLYVKSTIFVLLAVGCASTKSSMEAADAAVGVKSTQSNPLIGKIYVLEEAAGELGVASYHFQAEDNIYINYDNAPSEWQLDDGRPISKRKAFTKTSFSTSPHLFRGIIDWSTPEKSAVAGDVKWIYEMHFSDDYKRIIGGTAVAENQDGVRAVSVTFGKDLHYTEYTAASNEEAWSNSGFAADGRGSFGVQEADSQLIGAAKNGETETVLALLTKGADANERGEDGTTPLMYAAVGAHIETMDALIASGADVNARDETGRNVLLRTIGSDYLTVRYTDDHRPLVGQRCRCECTRRRGNHCVDACREWSDSMGHGEAEER